MELRWARRLVAALALGIATLALFQLEAARAPVSMERVTLAGSPATVYRADGAGPAPLAVVAHGFAGSRQMMEAISLTLAGSGMTVVAFDFVGHGRNGALLSPEVTAIDGTTAQLIAQTRAVTEAARALPAAEAPVVLVGHSMATDVAIRAAEALPDISAIVAISMYSEAITPDYPQRLLMVAGAWEDRLRRAGLEALHQIDAAAGEGRTVRAGAVIRRAIAAPNVEHVGVLYSPVTLAETQRWIAEAIGAPFSNALARTGPWIPILLAALVALSWALAATLGPAVAPPARLTGRRLLALALLPALPALAAAVFITQPVAGMQGFVRLAAFFGLWGLVQLGLLWRWGIAPGAPRVGAALLLLGWALVFALALDRYGAAFVPAGPRIVALAVLAVGALAFALADALVAARAALWQRWLLRVGPLLTLSLAMAAAPTGLGLMFTVLPVYLLFFVVYGTAGGFVARRSSPETAGVALGLIWAWSIAASLPLFGA